MSDETDVPIQPEPDEPAVGAGPPEAERAASAASETGRTGPSAGEAWAGVIVKLGELGDAISAWAKAAADTPENREHIDEVRAGVNDMAKQANEAFSTVASSDFGRQVAEGATQMGTTIGETAQEFGQAAAPHVASAFAGLANAFGRAAEKMGDAAAPPTPPEPPAATPMPSAEPPAGESDSPAAASEPEDDARE